MKTIKFRAWDKFDGMLYTIENLVIVPPVFNHLDFNQDHYGRITFYKSKDKSWEKHITGHSGILMQYTGLLDKNKKEIYEGDILLVQDEYTEPVTDEGLGPVEPSNHLAPVIFKNGCFGIDIKETENWFSKGFYAFESNLDDLGDLEIIGNIYENKELLEVSNE